MHKLQGLLAFVEAARQGSLSGAARKLDLTPAAVSKSVLKLESELGVRLFNRSTRRLRLTVEGEGFFQRAELVLRTLDEAVAEVSAATELPAGKVRISVGAFFGRYWVVPALPALLAQHPALQLEVDLENRPVDLVAEGVDIGIRGGIVRDSSLIARRICALPLVLVASPDYLARRGVPRKVAELSRHDALLVRFPSGSLSTWQFSGTALDDLPLSARLIVSEPEAVVDLALAGAGIAQAGLHHVLPHLQAGRLKVVLAGLHDPGSREIVLHYPHRQYLAPRVRVTVDYLLAHFAQAPALHLSAAEARAFSA
ncbi:MAG TPA: LysR substrate-binding domain-containing protein [Rhodocyclaceae bacterium]|nr:LysR substrate-binding domain-containing protein [Rhodocyclaceae bacterium]